MKEIRIILTSVGGLVAPGIIKSLKKKATENNERLFIVGIDMQKEAVGFYFVDRSYIVPSGDSKNYFSTLMKIARVNNINVIIPCSDEEILSISKERKRFIKNSIIPLCSDYDIVYKSNDKGLMLELLKEKGIPYPRFCVPTSIEEVIKFAKELNYPYTHFVVKPRLARGSRGFKIIKEEFDFFKDRTSNMVKLKYFIDILRDYRDFPDIVLMEYLPGEDYSVDALAYNGEPLYVIPRRRMKALGGPSVVGEIIQNDVVKNMVEEVIRVFGFHLNVNIQLKYSKEGIPLVYEINPRVSGTIVANDAAGVNLLYYGIKLALGQEIPRQSTIRRVKMLRYFKEKFLYE